MPRSNGASAPAGDPLLGQSGLSADELVELLELLAASDVIELELTVGTTHLSLRRPPARAPIRSVAEPPTPPSDEALAIASPLVGIFRPSVQVGESVAPGQSIGAIEALGMPTTVDAPQGGTVEDLLVATGTPVEYGQPLLVLRRSG